VKDAGRNHHHRISLLLRFGRWGTCSGCPRDPDGFPRPDLCEFTARVDHNISGDAAFNDEDLEHVRYAMATHNVTRVSENSGGER
jgi:hypothetical protein